MRSFSNLWYWIALAVIWSTASHWVLGVPFDMVVRVRRIQARGQVPGQAGEDLLRLTGVHVRRLMRIGREAGVIVALGGSFGLSVLVVLGFGYGFEFAQAVALLVGPLAVVWGMSLHTAARLEPLLAQGITAQAVAHRLARHRVGVQAVGLVAITVAAMWGMLQNLRLSPLG